MICIISLNRHYALTTALGNSELFQPKLKLADDYIQENWVNPRGNIRDYNNYKNVEQIYYHK